MILWTERHVILKRLLRVDSLVGKDIGFVLGWSSFAFLHLE